MIRFRDFTPERRAARGIFGRTTYGDLSEVMEKVNAWIEKSGFDVITIETVVLPNIYRPEEEGTLDPSIKTTNVLTTWHQFVRVWYRDGGE